MDEYNPLAGGFLPHRLPRGHFIQKAASITPSYPAQGTLAQPTCVPWSDPQVGEFQGEQLFLNSPYVPRELGYKFQVELQ
jgi:hypothetical protein